MAKILSVATHATDDPTKATLAFVLAVGAVGGEKECAIALLGEAVTIVKEPVAKAIHGVGFAPLPELIAKVLQAKTPVYV